MSLCQIMRGCVPKETSQRDRHVALAVDAGEDDDARGHGVRERIISGSLARLIGGHNEHNQEVTSAAAARPALSARSQN